MSGSEGVQPILCTRFVWFLLYTHGGVEQALTSDSKLTSRSVSCRPGGQIPVWSVFVTVSVWKNPYPWGKVVETQEEALQWHPGCTIHIPVESKFLPAFRSVPDAAF